MNIWVWGIYSLIAIATFIALTDKVNETWKIAINVVIAVTWPFYVATKVMFKFRLW